MKKVKTNSLFQFLLKKMIMNIFVKLFLKIEIVKKSKFERIKKKKG